MNTFKRKSLYAALAGVGALGAAGTVQAVNLNPDGLGSVLIYPYYTTRADAAGNAYNTLLTVVNSTSSAKAVKVRFLEGKNSREVLDFNLFLSANDVWTTAIIPSSSGGAKIITGDKSCTLPLIPAGGVDFVNYAYTGGGSPNDDKGGASLDRTREGYVEIIEMGAIWGATTTEAQVTHVNGVPPGCSSVTDLQAGKDTADAIGGLFGGATLINVSSGTAYTEDAVALENFNSELGYFSAGDIRPQLTDAYPESVVVSPNASFVDTNWAASPNTADAVSAVLMHNQVLNEFVLDSATKSGTDWVVTMPTKRFYVAVGTGNASRLFQRNFNTTAGSCDDITLDLYDREEFRKAGGFSPPPPGAISQLCWESTIISFNGLNVLGSANSVNQPTTFANGWMRLGFFPSSVTGNVHKLIAPNNATTVTNLGGGSYSTNATYWGLPVVGFAVQSFTNGSLSVGSSTVLSNYGGNFVHKTTKQISLPGQ